MNDYINLWHEIIVEGKKQNTYKLAWGRSIVEIINTLEIDTISGDTYTIAFRPIIEGMFKLYWNQTMFFNLLQGPNNKTPEMLQDLISFMSKVNPTHEHIWYYQFEKQIKKHPDYEKTIQSMINNAIRNVSFYFLTVKKSTLVAYQLDKSKKEITFQKVHLIDIQSSYTFLINLIDYVWAYELERFNPDPRIIHKVNTAAAPKYTRSDLSEFRELLIKFSGQNPKDFYTNQSLSPKEISADHFIPWSYMHSDDIWNLVLTSRSNNSSKSNSIPEKEFIEKIKRRNEFLLEFLKSLPEQSKFIQDLEMSLQNNFIQRFYDSYKVNQVLFSKV